MALLRTHGEVRLGTEPELRFTPAGMAVCSVRAVSSQRKKVNDEWVDDKTTWTTLVAFGQLAEHMVETVHAKDLVVVDGRLSVEDWESGDKKGTSVSVLLDSIGPSLSYATAEVTQVPRSNGAQQPARQQQAAPSQAPQSDEPPF